MTERYMDRPSDLPVRRFACTVHLTTTSSMTLDGLVSISIQNLLVVGQLWDFGELWVETLNYLVSCVGAVLALPGHTRPLRAI